MSFMVLSFCSFLLMPFRAEADRECPFQLCSVWVGCHLREAGRGRITLVFLAFRCVSVGDWPYDGEQDLAAFYVHYIWGA
jgi:hypothetical protein